MAEALVLSLMALCVILYLLSRFFETTDRSENPYQKEAIEKLKKRPDYNTIFGTFTDGKGKRRQNWEKINYDDDVFRDWRHGKLRRLFLRAIGAVELHCTREGWFYHQNFSVAVKTPYLRRDLKWLKMRHEKEVSRIGRSNVVAIKKSED